MNIKDELENAYNEIITYQQQEEGEVRYTKEDLRSDYHELLNIIKKPLYRCIQLRDIKELDYNQLGEYWTDDKMMAKPYEGRGGNNYVVEAMVNIEDVEIGNTIVIRRLFPEEEIRLKSGRSIKVLNIYHDWKPLNISGEYFT